ncbi:MAG: DUF883 C-terminal domain-containing protein [Candidatus Jettenia sp. CY-1]|nr:MAG: DUF883 C-terminal domain-containing protein [Candidatus Jettenia sp. CY-1]
MPLKKEGLKSPGTRKRRESKMIRKSEKEGKHREQREKRRGEKAIAKQHIRKTGSPKGNKVKRKGAGVMSDQTEEGRQEDTDDLSKEKKGGSAKEPQGQGDASKINEALEFLNKEAKGKKEEINRLISEKYSAMKGVMIRATGTSEMMEKIKHDMSEAMAGGEEKLKEMTTDIDKKIHENPWLYIGIAVAGGFLLGYMIAGNKIRHKE